MSALTYDPMKAVFKSLSLKKRLQLVEKGGVFETLYKVCRPISFLEIHKFHYMIDENAAFVRNNTVSIDNDVVFRGESDSDCVRHILNLNPENPVLEVDSLLVEDIDKGITYFDPKNANHAKVVVRDHLKIVNAICLLKIFPLLRDPENLRKLTLLVFCEFTYQSILQPEAQKCKKLIVSGTYFPTERMVPFMQKSNHQHLHIQSFWRNGTSRHLMEFIDLWVQEFRPIGTSFTCVLPQHKEFVVVTHFTLPKKHPTAFASNGPEMDGYTDGMTLPLDENRELVINSEPNRNVGYGGNHVFRMRIMEKGYSVSTK